MPIYLSEYIGSGTHADPFRPRGSDQPGWAAIDLRADGGATLDGNGLKYCLLSLPVADADPRLYQLAEQKGEDLTLTIRAGMAARLNATINYTRFDDIIADLLLRPPTNAWKPLRDQPTKPLAIYLDGLLSPSPALRALAAQTYTETWSTADSGSLTSDLTWTEYYGTAWGITGNRARMAGHVNSNHARADHDTDTDDQVVTATLSTFTFGGNTATASISCRSESDGVETHYTLTAWRDSFGPKNEWILQKGVAGSYTTLATDTTDPVAGDLMEVSANDNTIRGRVNSGALVLGPVTDTVITGRYRGGIGCYIDHASTVVEFDGWEVRDYDSGPARTLVMVASPLRW
jgi:hypothetical protein